MPAFPQEGPPNDRQHPHHRRPRRRHWPRNHGRHSEDPQSRGRSHRHRDHRDRREGLSGWQFLRHPAVGLGVPPADQGVPESPHHDPSGRRIQEPERHHPQDPRPLRQCAPLRLLPPVRRNQAPGHGRRHRPRERRGPLRRHRVPPDARRLRVPEVDHPAGLREDRSIRVRVRPAQRPQEGHLLHERQHHEADRRPFPQGLRRDRRCRTRTSRKSTGSWTSGQPSWPTRPRSSTSS